MANPHPLLREITQPVRSALAYLYDYAYLQNHPLAFALDPDKDLDHLTRAQNLRRALLDGIETLRPQGRGSATTEATRPYAILTYRYVDRLSMEEIASKLALSRRQVYREHSKGVRAVSCFLWDRIRQGSQRGEILPAKAPDAADRLSVAEAELARLHEAVRAETLDVDSILEGVINLLQPRMWQTDTTIRLTSAETRASIVTDRVMLRQALINLLSHAMDVTTNGELYITVSPHDSELQIKIQETAGFAKQPVPHTHPAPSRLGLTVARALIEAQGGELQVRPHAGRWQALVSLPASHRNVVLAIDDNRDILTLFQRYLGGYDVHVVGATDGQQALRLAAELQPQVITLDVMMPNQDGWEILQRLKSLPGAQHIPVVVCSVLNEPQLALATGASDYISKPVSQVDLLRVLRRWVGGLRPVA